MRLVKFSLYGALNVVTISYFVFLLFACSNSSSSSSINDNGPDGIENSQNPSTTIEYGKTVTYGGQTYKTVIIGTQRWFAENLNYYDESDTLFTKYSWCPDNEQENCKKYGRLYTYYTLMKIHDVSADSINTVQTEIQGICPEGWHVPSDSDWNVLLSYVGRKYERGLDMYYIDAGFYLKSINGWDGSGMDAYGFNVLNAGYIETNIYYSWRTLFWASSRTAYIFTSGNRNATFAKNYLQQGQGLSVRCVANALVSTSAEQVEYPGYVDPSSSKEGAFTYVGQTYKTVTIGSQTWFAENLNYYDTTETQLDSSWCYNNLPENCEKYGRLYNYPAAVIADNSYNILHRGSNDSIIQGVCPVGWHIPRSLDWDILGAAMGNNWNKGIKGLNKYGFNLSASGAYVDGSFIGLDSTIYIWNSTSFVDTYLGLASSAYAQQFFDDFTNNRETADFKTGAYIRCIKDADFFSKDYERGGICKSRLTPIVDGDTLYDPRDKNKYRITTIGNQTWFGENLAYATANTTPSLNKNNRGLLYKWLNAMQLDTTIDKNWAENIKYPHQGVCPLGWHIPTQSDWNSLNDYISLTTDSAGYYLKSKSGWINPDDSTANANGNDFYGFNMTPEGSEMANSDWIDYDYVYVWSSTFGLTSGGYYQAYPAVLSARSYEFSGTGYGKFLDEANPVRCLKDSDES